MNIFVVHKDPVVAAQMLCDKHIIKMPLESAQMLSNCIDHNAPYKRTHYNHPCSVWVRESKGNFMWLYEHGIALCKEYTTRYEKTHKCEAVIEQCYALGYHNIPDGELTDFKQAIPVEYKCIDPVRAYRNYYVGDKAYMATWKCGRVPAWFCEGVALALKDEDNINASV